MKLTAPFLQLPVKFDADALAAEVAALGELAWMPHPQRYEGNDFLPLISAYGEPTNEAFEGPMLPTPFLERSPQLIDVLGSLGATLGRTRLMRLTGHAEVTPHVDAIYYWMERMRVHIPIVTQPTVSFHCGTAKVHMAAGECWIFDTWSQHRVINDAEQSRIHLVADTVGGEGFWKLVSAGRVHGQSIAGWVAHPHRPRGLKIGDVDYENLNVPTVMTPWELREHVGFVFSHVVPNQPQLPQTFQAVAKFLHGWRGLWSAFGDAAGGFPRYRKIIDDLMEDLRAADASKIMLQNQMGLVPTLHRMVLNFAIADANRDHGAGEVREPLDKASVGGAAKSGYVDPVFDRPVFVISPPRSGSTLLFETIAKAPDLCTIGGESHALIEGIEALTIERSKTFSNRLDATDATAEVVAILRERFRGALRDRTGRSPARGGRVRMLEKTPKNALRVPLLAAAFPEAQFVFLYRDPREVLASMMEAWESGRFRTYPGLPGWSGALPWSLLLVPGWQELVGLPLNELVAAQWATTMRTLLDDLEQIPKDRLFVTHYSKLTADPAAEIASLCGQLGLRWDAPIGASLPVASYTVSQPKKDKWKAREAELARVLPRLQSLMDRAERFANT